MGTKRYEVSETIDAPVDSVFAASANITAWPETISGITGVEILTDQPADGMIAPGMRFNETRVMMGRESTEEFEVTSVEPGRGYSMSCSSCGCLYESTMSFHPVSRGTRIELVTEGTPMTLMAKLMMPVMAPMMKKMMLKCLSEDLADLKAACEGGPRAETAEGGVAAV